MHEILVQLNNLFQRMGLEGLALNSFVESFFLVPPPDILLITMNLAKPERALYFALICTLFSALGGIVGYLIGLWGGRPVFNLLFKNKQDQFKKVENLYDQYGSLAVFFSAFTPVPYKIFTIASGILKMNFTKFFIASFFGRGLRFFIVSVVLMFFGQTIKNYIELVIIGVTVLMIMFFVIIYKKRHILK